MGVTSCMHVPNRDSCCPEDVFMMVTDFRRQTSSLPFSVGCALFPRMKVRYLLQWQRQLNSDSRLREVIRAEGGAV